MSEKQLNSPQSHAIEYGYAGALPPGSEALSHGFTIDMLHKDAAGEPFEAVTVDSEAILQDIESNEAIRFIAEPTEVQTDEELVNVYATLPLQRADIEAYHPEIAQKVADRYYVDEKEMEETGLRATYSEELNTLLDKALFSRIVNEYDADFIHIPTELLKENPFIHQVFEFISNNKTLRLYNFGTTRVGEQALAKVANAIREMAQLTGGLVFDTVPVMAIAPEDFPRFGTTSADAQAIGGTTVKAYAMGTGTIVFNENLLTEEESKDQTFSVGGNDIEYVAFHELAHAVSKGNYSNSPEADFAESIGWKFEKDSLGAIDKTKPIIKPDVSAPSRYGSITPGEDLAESATARFAGSDWEDAVSADRKDAIKKMYQTVHTGFIGPVHVRCKDLDLNEMKSKIGSKYNGKKIAILPHVQIIIN